jgi:hypothetical protein
MKIINPSNSERCRIAEDLLASYEFKNTKIKRIVLLPVPSFRDGVRVSGTELTKDSVAELVLSGDLVVGYNLPAELCLRVSERGALALDLAFDEGYIRKNNELTAHATLGYILSERGRDISELRVGIIGYGRLGATLLRLLLFLGADVTVFSGSTEKCRALAREGINCRDYAEIPSRSVDVLINTAPERLFSGDARTALFLDLASGNHYQSSTAVFLPALPEKRYPKSAGKAYARAVIDYCDLH